MQFLARRINVDLTFLTFSVSNVKTEKTKKNYHVYYEVLVKRENELAKICCHRKKIHTFEMGLYQLHLKMK